MIRGGDGRADGTAATAAWGGWRSTVPAGVVVLLGCVYITQHLLGWLAYDDEGGYLYAAWRISLGELPYRDFLTPQLPAFLYPGALLMRLTDASVLAARLSMTAYTLAACWLLFLTVRRLWGWRAALLSLVLTVAQSEVYWAGRFFRPEAPMLFWAGLGLYLFVRGYPERRRWPLALSGATLSLAMMSKLFGALPMAGIGLFLASELMVTRDGRDAVRTGLTVAIPFALVVLVIGGTFSALAPNFLAAVLGHHLRQGRGTPAVVVAGKGLALYRGYVLAQPAYIALAAGGGALSLVRRRGLRGVFAWQLPTALAFLALTRDLQARHFTYVVPALGALGGIALDRLWGWTAGSARLAWRKGLGVLAGAAILAVALWPQVAHNRQVAGWRDTTLPAWVDYIQAHTAPDDYVMSDYPGLNFFARRPTTPLAAGISRGAASSGQIMGSDLIEEIEAHDVQMVLLNVAQGSHQFVRLLDYPAFKEYVQSHFALAERRTFDYRLMEVYAREDLWPGERLRRNLADQFELTGAHWLAPEAAPGEQFRVQLRWRSLAPLPHDYGVSLQLVDARGHAWGLGHKQLMDIDRETYWDEKGLEQPILIPTSQWPVGEATIGTYELPVDPATPPGRYTVLARVHAPGAWDDLFVLDESGAPAGYDVAIGSVVVVPAPTPIEPAGLAMDHRVDADVGPGIRLLGHSRLPGQVRPGDEAELSLVWMATGEGLPACRLRLMLMGAGAAWGELVTDMAGEGYDPSHWRQGEVLRGRYDLVIDAETPNGRYEIRAELIDGQGQPIGQSYTLGSVEVAGRQRLYDVPEIGKLVEARLGGAVTLLGYDLATDELRPGESLEMTLYWRAEARMGTRYKVFTHIVDVAEHVWGQQDNEPVEGTYPTTGWLPGEIIVDRYRLPLDDDAPAGEYRVEVGMYDAATIVRLAAIDADGAPLAHDRVLLGSVRVLP
jgi:hypothetical protein